MVLTDKVEALFKENLISKIHDGPTINFQVSIKSILTRIEYLFTGNVLTQALSLRA